MNFIYIILPKFTLSISTFSSANHGLRFSFPSMTHAMCNALIAICNEHEIHNNYHSSLINKYNV